MHRTYYAGWALVDQVDLLLSHEFTLTRKGGCVDVVSSLDCRSAVTLRHIGAVYAGFVLGRVQHTTGSGPVGVFPRLALLPPADRAHFTVPRTRARRNPLLARRSNSCSISLQPGARPVRYVLHLVYRFCRLDGLRWLTGFSRSPTERVPFRKSTMFSL